MIGRPHTIALDYPDPDALADFYAAPAGHPFRLEYASRGA